MCSWLPRALLAALGLLVLLEIFTIAPSPAASAVVATVCWMVLPGVLVTARVAGVARGGRMVAWLVGPALGLGLSVFGLLPLWAAGLQGWPALVLAPWLSWLVVAGTARWGGPTLRLPPFDRRDVGAVAVALLVVPLITFAAYDHVGEPTRDGEAYRAYFTADFMWATAVTAELAKGDVPPANPFLRHVPMRYYWMSHLLSGAVYRNVSPWGVTSRQVLLIDGVFYGLALVASLYALARASGGGAAFSALAVIVAFTANSYEALDRLIVFFRNDTPLEYARMINIDAVTRWYYDGMPVDGLQRLLLYQPHHIVGYVLALSAVWLVALAEDVTEAAVPLGAGILLALGFLFSTFTAIIVGGAVGLVYVWRLLQQGVWRAWWQCALLGCTPVVVAVATATALGYADPRAGTLVQIGPNPVALRRWPLMFVLSFGPLLAAGAAALAQPRWIAREGAAAAALAVSALVFYFLTDVPDMAGVWVGWRAGHVLLIAFLIVGAAVLTRTWPRLRTRGRRAAAIAGLALLIVPALPTVVIDAYNAQDVSNRANVVGFPWTVVISPEEREALDWIRRFTPQDAIVQVAPRAHGAATFTYIQTFAERRAAAGLPSGMIPLQPYQAATDTVTMGIFEAYAPHEALEMARFLGIDFLVMAPADRRLYPATAQMFDEHPEPFVPVFRNDAVTVYDVRRR